MEDRVSNALKEKSLVLAPESQAVAPSFDASSNALAAHAQATVQARAIMAIRCPRNWDAVRQTIVSECSRPTFANNKSAIYTIPIDKQKVTGLGIRFVEMALNAMGNVLVETIMVYEDDQKELYRVMATDLERNSTYFGDAKITKTVERSKPNDDGTYISVRRNSRGYMAYTVPATEGEVVTKRNATISKVLRTVGLRLIPGHLQDEAYDLIMKVRMNEDAKDPDAARNNIIDAFHHLNIGVKELEEYMGNKIAQATPAQIEELRGFYASLKAGDTTWAQVMECREKKDDTKKKPPQEEGPSLRELTSMIFAGRVDDALAMKSGLSESDQDALEKIIENYRNRK